MNPSLRVLCTGRPARPVHFFIRAGCAAAALALVTAPIPAPAAPLAGQAAVVAAPSGGQSVEDFYQARDGKPLWLSAQASVPALIRLLETAEADGLNPKRYKVKQLARAVRSARGGDYRAIQKAEALLSATFVDYVRDLKRPPNADYIYVDRELATSIPSPRDILEFASAAPSLEAYVTNMGWMNPLYADLRSAYANRTYANDTQRRLLELNLERARALHGGAGRAVVVNIAAQRLYAFENGKLVDTMRVVVGKPKNPTPMMAAYIRFAALNPYWNVPPDLTAERIAPNVLSHGLGYLREKGYQVLSDWGDKPTVADPSKVDWKAVAEGREEIRIRQLPGPVNAMGQMKFMFPNNEGVYLHDTPEKELLTEASRLFSGGCVRLEDAPRLAKWMFGRPLNPKGARAEQKVMLPKPVPVFLTYMTAVPSGSQIAYFGDIYGRDRVELAQRGGRRSLASR